MNNLKWDDYITIILAGVGATIIYVCRTALVYVFRIALGMVITYLIRRMFLQSEEKFREIETKKSILLHKVEDKLHINVCKNPLAK